MNRKVFFLALVVFLFSFGAGIARASITFSAPTDIAPGSTPYGLGFVMGADGFPRIAYRDGYVDGVPQQLYYIVCGDSNCTSKTTTVVASDSTTDDRVGSNILALGSDGFGRIVYMNTDGNIQFVRCNNAVCSAKDINPITTANNSDDGSYGVGLVMGNDGLPRMEYEASDSTVHFIRCTTATCSSFVDTTVNTDAFNSYDEYGLAIGTDGFARIIFEKYSDNSFMMIRCTNDDCTTKATNTIVDAPDSYGYGKDIKLGSDSFPRIVRVDRNYNLSYIKCNDADCVDKTTTDFFKTQGNTYENNFTFGLRSGDLASIPYIEDGTGKIHVINCTNQSCSAYDDVTIDNNLSNVSRFDMAFGGMPLLVDGSNGPRIIYSNYAPFGDLTTGLFYSIGTNTDTGGGGGGSDTTTDEPVHHASGGFESQAVGLRSAGVILINNNGAQIATIRATLIALIQQLIKLLQQQAAHH